MIVQRCPRCYGKIKVSEVPFCNKCKNEIEKRYQNFMKVKEINLTEQEKELTRGLIAGTSMTEQEIVEFILSDRQIQRLGGV